VQAIYFMRHWKRGPHVRINVRTDQQTFDTVVRPSTAEIVGRYLASRPSRDAPDPGTLLPMHKRLAELEQEDGPLLPWHPDNSIQLASYDYRLQVLGNRVTAELLASFLADTNELAFQMIDHVRSGGQRLRLCFDLMIAVAHLLREGGIMRGFAAYRSHAEAFLCTKPEAHGRRELWDRHYKAHAPSLIRRVRELVAALDGQAAPVPLVTPWVRTLARHQARGRKLIEAGEISMEPPARARTSGTEPAEYLAKSAFHHALEHNQWWVRQVKGSVGFAAYRLALNYTYLHLTRLGVTPQERFLLCHLAANAVEELFGISAIELLRRHHDPLPPGEDGT
jgi:hypothetical protein